MDALIQANNDKLILIILVLSLPGLISLLRDWARTRRERRESQDTGRLQRIQAEAEAEKRHDDILSQSLSQNTRLIDSINALVVQMETQHEDRTKDREIETKRIDMRERVANAQNQSLIENTQAVGEVAANLNRVKTELGHVEQKVGAQNLLLADGFTKTSDVVSRKIDSGFVSALGKAGDMLNTKIDPVQDALEALRKSIEEIQNKLSHIEEETGHIPDIEQCMNETNFAIQELTKRTSEIVAERDSALNDVQALRNALLFVDRDKISKDAELARLKEVVNPPVTTTPPAVPQPATNAAEAAQ